MAPRSKALQKNVAKHHSVQILDKDRSINYGEARIIGHRHKNHQLLYTLQLDNRQTFDVPVNDVFLSRIFINSSQITFNKQLLEESEFHRLIGFTADAYYVRMRPDSNFKQNEEARIVGYRSIDNQIFYTILFSNLKTFDIPAKPEELLKLCTEMPYHIYAKCGE